MSSSELSKYQAFILEPSQEMVRNHYSMSSHQPDMAHPIHAYALLIQVFCNHYMHLSVQGTGAVSEFM